VELDDIMEPSGSASAEARGATPFASASELEEWLVVWLAEQLGFEGGEVDRHCSFHELGMDSADAVELAGDLERRLGRSVSPALLWEYPCVAELAAQLSASVAGTRRAAGLARAGERPAAPDGGPVAVVGLGCRLPGAPDPEAFFELLRDGRDATGPLPAARRALLREAGIPEAMLGALRGAFVDDVDGFDARFFHISPREAARMDPQHRLLLEVAWQALEDAGCADPSTLRGSATGVFVGLGSQDYAHLAATAGCAVDLHTITGNAASVAANRLSYFLDLRGPSLTVDTACSASLVAVHLACEHLRRGECDLAIAGGVSLLLDPRVEEALRGGDMLAPDGRCKTFDAEADGYARGEGCGVIVLKRLDDAIAEDDPVRALLLGSAVNQDGASNGLTAPNGLAQEEVVETALKRAGLSARALDYIELHGTGTPLGDPIEARALGRVLERSGRSESCRVGSVKTNVAHLEAAAGIAGLLKVVLALERETLLPHRNLNRASPYVPLDALGLRVPLKPEPWPRSERPRRAGVSSFGFGGTNAHVIVGEAPRRPERGATGDETRRACLVPVSARTARALEAQAGRWAEHLAAHPELGPEDVALTAGCGRAHLPERLAVVASSGEVLCETLASAAQGRESPGLHRGRGQAPEQRRIAFLFTGQGAQYAGMGWGLYEQEPVFREAMDACDEAVAGELDLPLLSVLYGEHDDCLGETLYTQCALFALELALARLWRSWGVVPDAVLGHSLGEYAAACVAGVLSERNALSLVLTRARRMQVLPTGGAMASVAASETQVEAALAGDARDVSIAAVNSRESTVVSGPEAGVAAVCEALAEEGIESRRLDVSRAFHSVLVEPACAALDERARTTPAVPPAIPLVSNVTGKLFEAGSAPPPDYWARQARVPVRFADGLRTLRELGCRLFVEIGPRPTLLGLMRGTLSEEEACGFPSLRPQRDDATTLLGSLGALYTLGTPVDWSAVNAARGGRRVSLPPYPFAFEHDSAWLPRSTRRAPAPAAPEPPRPAAPGCGAGSSHVFREQLELVAEVTERQLAMLRGDGPLREAVAVPVCRASELWGEPVRKEEW